MEQRVIPFAFSCRCIQSLHMSYDKILFTGPREVFGALGEYGRLAGYYIIIVATASATCADAVGGHVGFVEFFGSCLFGLVDEEPLHTFGVLKP